MPLASKIFTGYRVLGYISNHVPLDVQYNQRVKGNYVVTCVGRSFHKYSCTKLALQSVSDAHPDEISCLAIDGQKTFTGCGNVIRVFIDGKKVEKTLEGHDDPIHILLPFGAHLLSVDSNSNVKVWDIDAGESYDQLYLEFTFDPSLFAVSTAIHPSTYMNKILFGSTQGGLKLWNIKSNKLIHSFNGWGVHVTALEQAPAVDVIAVGLADGQILLHNIRYDETIVKFRQDWGLVTAITFRTDGQPLMLTGSTEGHIAVWDLEERRLSSQIREAHYGSVTGLKCLPNEPLLVTSSPDNSLKLWIFDMTDGGGRLLNQRAGHSAPPNVIRHYSHNGRDILSAGQDSKLLSFSTTNEFDNKSLGRASFNKKSSRRSGLKADKHMMSAITHFSAECTRASDWDNIIATHRGLGATTTWNYQRSTMGQYIFLHKRLKAITDITATCTTITSCGNFAVIGYSTGDIDMYNLQSGIYKGSFTGEEGHKTSVRGIITDGLNQILVSAASNEYKLTFWRFKTKEVLCKVPLQDGVAQLVLHRDSAMLAVALDDFNIVIVDIDTHTVVREFKGHSSKVNDMCFSPDCRWLISSSIDSTVRTWDLPSARLIDCFLVDTAVTSLSFSPTTDFLVTSHIDDLGLYLWSNMTLYNYVSLPPLPIDYQPSTIAMPTTNRPVTDSTIQEEDDVDVTMVNTDFKSKAQISHELVTLSLLPESRWKNLLNLDIIKMRNKPKEPPKAPKSAPFFLPTLPGLGEITFNITQDDVDTTNDKRKISLLTASEFGQALFMADSNDKYIESFTSLTTLGPSLIDTEIRSLSPENGGSLELMNKFVTCIGIVLDTNRHFEIAQSFLALFLKVHSEVITEDQSLKDSLRLLVDKQKSSWLRLQNMLDQSLCLVTYTRSATL